MKYYLTACTRFNNKAVHDIVEFIDYHSVVGVEHFYLVNTEIDVSLSESVLKPYIEKGLVTLLHYPINKEYYYDSDWIHCYSVANHHANGNCRWMMYLDIDEFVLPLQKESVSDFLKDYENYSVVAVNWLIFGTSGFVDSPSSQLEHLVHRSEFGFSVNMHVKCIGDPSKFAGMNTPHHILTIDQKNVNSNYDFCYGPLSSIVLDKIRINHYVIKSKKDYENDTRVLPYKDKGWFVYHDRNEVFDDEIWKRFGDKVREFHKSIHG
jgi:hypothetical protein